jgi:hypothetical protein
MSVSNDATNRIPISHRKLRLLTVRIVMNRPTQSGARVSPGLAGVRKASSRSLRRQSSEIRAVCAN